jgi:predicted ferric reductase
MYTVHGLLIVLAFLFTVAHILSAKVPIWIGVLLLCIAALMGVAVR